MCNEKELQLFFYILRMQNMLKRIFWSRTKQIQQSFIHMLNVPNLEFLWLRQRFSFERRFLFLKKRRAKYVVYQRLEVNERQFAEGEIFTKIAISLGLVYTRKHSDAKVIRFHRPTAQVTFGKRSAAILQICHINSTINLFEYQIKIMKII